MTQTLKEAAQWRQDNLNRVACAVVTGYDYDPGDSDLDDEQPILVRMTPELLEACRAAFMALPMAKYNEATNAMLKAAIAKAEGRTAEALSR